MSDIKVTDMAGKNQHVDTSITSAQFLDTARCAIYAASPKTAANSLETVEFIPIGLIQGVNFSEQRDIARIFELGSDVPYLIPGRTMGNLSISRILIQGRDLVNALYNKEENPQGEKFIASLKDIAVPLYLMFVAKGNKTGADTTEPKYSRVFQECWINSRSESLSAGQSIIAENVSITYGAIQSVNISMK